MFDPNRPYSFHVELTDKCNAGCPMCGRTDAMNRCQVNRQKVRKIELTLDDFTAQFTPAFCRRVEEVQFGGGLGDALAASECLEICDYLTAQGVRLIVSTNGSLRSRDWWQRFGTVMARNGSHLELHIDGLRDTNALYRINTDFDRILANAEAYLASGAVADWYYILFRHNEHQVEEARDLARSLGFRHFVLIDTIRFGKTQRFDYVFPDGTPGKLEPSQLSAADYRERVRTAPDLEEEVARPVPSDGKAAEAAAGINGIRCKAQMLNRPYITADGNVSACCWIDHSEEERGLQARAGRRFQDYNIRTRPLEDILQDEPFASLYRTGWERNVGAVCRRKCGEGLRNKRSRL